MLDEVWRKSTRSTDTNCVEVAARRGLVIMRDSKDRRRMLAFSEDGWDAFVAGVRAGEFDRA
ncbi:DUF397 domain-containing protein [Hamadaea tsunoensis]|uniref:DUF397 domain-containing protein n=1 Tax=Hamadaea tsunoensis TaxID=53368 RepID=UPI000408AA9F|nr:DUF397 domain-containing protein [Hamadaea tsunoensis]